MINVTKSFLPPLEEYTDYLKVIWDNYYLTNQGPLLKDLESKISQYAGLKNVNFVTNGTIALDLALNALDITEGEVITTPFSFVATVGSILWERCVPVFVDIDEKNLCINAENIEEKISEKTKAIMAVHVFGYPCDIDKIEKIAKKNNLKVIYDGAHAFGAVYKNKSLLSYGDITTCSFHATKLFHTVEGGLCVVKDDEVNRKLDLIKRFGFDRDDYRCLGTNAKNSEFHAAMGLANIKHIDEIIKSRKFVCDKYDQLLDGVLGRPVMPDDLSYNYSYYPVMFKSEEQLLYVLSALNKEGIFPRRYFYPSLNTLPYIKNSDSCPVSEDISKRIACLPLYVGLEEKDILNICKIIEDNLEK